MFLYQICFGAYLFNYIKKIGSRNFTALTIANYTLELSKEFELR